MHHEEDISLDKRGVSSCRGCIHYYTTWDKEFPHGCKAMGFKCKTPPALLVKASSGMNCLLFSGKESE